jgi:hemerythrin-like metal-binding protein
MITLPGTEHAQMDGEHRTLTGWLEQAAARIGDAEGKEESLYALDVVCHLARSHFEHEHAEMSAWNYPRLAEHRHDHTRLLGELAGLRREFIALAGRIDEPTSAALRERLAAWMLAHVVEHDRPYAIWLQRGDDVPAQPG